MGETGRKKEKKGKIKGGRKVDEDGETRGGMREGGRKWEGRKENEMKGRE